MTRREMYVHDPAVDVTKFLEAEKTSAVGGVIENIALYCESEGTGSGEGISLWRAGRTVVA